MPRPRSLTESGIAVAALAIVDRDGLASLSMRTVATEMGVGTMSLYRYVAGRDELEGLLLGHVLESVDLEVAKGSPWTERVVSLAERVRAAIGDHPAVVPLLLTRRQVTAPSLGWGEAVMAALADGGFTGPDRAIAFRALLSYVIGAVQVEHFGPLAGAGTAALADLPTDVFPHLADTARHARAIPSDEEFRRGLQIVLRGLGAP
jgi:AcrR family transcriptional regulator